MSSICGLEKRITNFISVLVATYLDLLSHHIGQYSLVVDGIGFVFRATIRSTKTQPAEGLDSELQYFP